MITLGVDIGGTKINFALLEERKILKTEKVATPKTKKELLLLLENKIKEFGASRVGIGAAGALNKRGDKILNSPNLKILNNCSLARIIEKRTGVKTRMENDANCFTLGETLMGAGKGAKIVFGITLGTGIGEGIVINRKIYRGAFGAAGEGGHMTINFLGKKSVCGNYGCLEEYASAKFFKNKGDKRNKKNYSEYGKYVGIGLSNVINLLDPEVIVVGGGISSNYDDFIEETKKQIQKSVISPLSKKYIKIKKAVLGEFGGAVGAALLN